MSETTKLTRIVAMEFATCLASPGPSTDPSFNQASPTFASCSGTAVSGGAGATTCIGASPVCSAISGGYQAEDYFGSHVFTIPVWDGLDVQARLSNWPLGGSSPGFITASAISHAVDDSYIQVRALRSAVRLPYSRNFYDTLQITGCLDATKFQLDPSDTGGQFDVRYPNGAYCMFSGYGASFIEL